MASKNDITGDSISSKVLSENGRANWDLIFPPKKSSYQWMKECVPQREIYNFTEWAKRGLKMEDKITKSLFDEIMKFASQERKQISRIFFDLDETLIYTMIDEFPKDHEYLSVIDNSGLGPDYHFIVNPYAKDMIEYAQSLVGNENIFILTAAGKNYARKINSTAKFGFREENIFSYDDIRARKFQSGWELYNVIVHEDLKDENNVLIDNLPYRLNDDKCNFIGIRDVQNRYIQVRDFYGDATIDYFSLVKERLDKLL